LGGRRKEQTEKNQQSTKFTPLRRTQRSTTEECNNNSRPPTARCETLVAASTKACFQVSLEEENGQPRDLLASTKPITPASQHSAGGRNKETIHGTHRGRHCAWKKP
jgi:hypothetical protein